MYRIDDKKSAIEEVQRYLHFIAERNILDIPRVAIDGIYGDETKNSVIEFQKYKGMDATGVVDNETFDEIYKSFLESEFYYESENFLIDKALFPFKPGDIGDEVLLLNLMINTLAKEYKAVYPVKTNGYFSERTEAAVLDLRKIFMLEESSEIDLELYDRMQYEISVRSFGT